MKLYGYWRSTTSYRVRAALNLKSVPYETIPVDLVAGAQRAPEYRALNASNAVPTLVLEDGTVLTQSLAIIDYLEARCPSPALLPSDPVLRSKVIGAAHIIALDIHPVNNLRVVQRLKAEHHVSEQQAIDWMRHWMIEGFEAFEALVPASTTFAFGDSPSLADLCLIAQVYNAHRWGVSLDPFPKIESIEAACLALPEIVAAHPDNQPDAKDVT